MILGITKLFYRLKQGIKSIQGREAMTEITSIQGREAMTEITDIQGRDMMIDRNLPNMIEVQMILVGNMIATTIDKITEIEMNEKWIEEVKKATLVNVEMIVGLNILEKTLETMVGMTEEVIEDMTERVREEEMNMKIETPTEEEMIETDIETLESDNYKIDIG